MRSPNTASWLRSDGTFELRAERIAASVQPAEPWLGLQSVTFERPIPGAYLQVHFSAWQRSLPTAEQIDTFVVGTDLVSTYEQRDADCLRSQVRYQMLATDDLDARGACGIRLLLSAQTSLLDSDPSARVTTILPQFTAYCLAADGSRSAKRLLVSETTYAAQPADVFLFRCDGLPFSCLQLAHPRDVSHAQVEVDPTTDTVRAHFYAFDERLEKGVIRRARFATYWVPAEDDVAAARKLYERFMTACLPLTA